jgi:hypothetical protein
MPRTKIPSNTIRDVLTEAGYRCAVPTCRNILAIDLHHIVEVKDEGKNELSNLLALCPTCHALYTRGTISKESINAWKTMLVALSHAFDQESISNLLFLKVIAEDFYKSISNYKGEIQELKEYRKANRTSYALNLNNEIRDLNMLLVSGDGVLKFSHLIASKLATYYTASVTNNGPLYIVELTTSGQKIVNAWFSGNREQVKEALQDSLLTNNTLPSR